jgi:hypothetical protein
MLSYSCGDFESEPGQWYWYYPENDFVPLQTSRRKRCQSCKELINIGADTIKFPRFKIPDTDVEVKIYGEDGEIPLAPWFLCEKCGEIYLNLNDIGYCLGPVDMREALQEYHERTGFKQAKAEEEQS